MLEHLRLMRVIEIFLFKKLGNSAALMYLTLDSDCLNRLFLSFPHYDQ
jgi:hypothetical protein